MIQTPAALDPTQLLSLNCFLLGDEPDRMFTVKIPKTENVSILKDLIKERKSFSLGNVDVTDIELFQVSLSRDVLTSAKYGENLKDDVKALGLGQSLDSMETLSNIPWSDLGEKKVHVIIGRLRQSGELQLAMSLLS